MPSFALRIVWFSLSLSGLLALWVVLGRFSRAYEPTWARVLYCLGCTLLHGIFCIGLVWRMDPLRMPRAFCIAQTLLLNFSSLFLTGICATLSYISSLIYWKRFDSITHSQTLLSWRNIYVIPILSFPLAGTAAQAIAIFTLDAVHPSDGLNCDASNPSWVRFLGYAGLPLLLALPVFCFSFVSIIHAFGQKPSPRHSDTNWDVNSGPFTTLRPRRTHYKDFRKYTTTPPIPRVLPSPSPSTQLRYATSPRRAPISPTLTSPILSARQFHLPFSPLAQENLAETDHRQNQSHSPSLQDTDSRPVSSLFPTFAPPSNSVSPYPDSPEHGPADFMDYLYYRDEWKSSSGNRSSPHEQDDDETSPVPVRWKPEDCDEFGQEAMEFGEHEDKYMFARDRPRRLSPDDPDMSYMVAPRSIPSPPIIVTDNSPRGYYYNASLPNDSAPHLWTLIISQLSFFITLVLTCISPLIDAIAHRDPPSSFGTQHVALLFSVWIPVLLIGCLNLWRT